MKANVYFFYLVFIFVIIDLSLACAFTLVFFYVSSVMYYTCGVHWSNMYQFIFCVSNYLTDVVSMCQF